MNERIRQLADQAHEYASGVYDQRIATEGPENVFFYQISNDKFAELIVQECLGIVEGISPGYKDYRNQIEDAFRRDCMEEIKQHFGVEL